MERLRRTTTTWRSSTRPTTTTTRVACWSTPTTRAGSSRSAQRQGAFGTGYNTFGFARPCAAAWHHYALVFDRNAAAASELRAYVDGALVSGTKPASTNTLGNFAQSTLYFMSRAGSSLFGAGDLDEVAIYNRALSAAEITDHHSRGTGGGGPPPNQSPMASFTVTPNPATTGQTVAVQRVGVERPGRRHDRQVRVGPRRQRDVRARHRDDADRRHGATPRPAP